MTDRPHGTLLVALAFLTSVAGSAGFITAYQLDAGTQWLALAAAAALGGLGTGLAWWSRRLMPQQSSEEPRPELAPPPGEEREAARTFERGRQGIRRRGILGGLLASALGAIGLGAAWSVSSLGPAPSSGLRNTGWREGVYLVDDRGNRVPVDTLDVGGVLTVFPEGRDPRADDQVVLIRVPLEDLDLPAGRQDWTPAGYIAFSKVCTHAGCPVGLYQDVGYFLLCPCHQATFDVVRGALPVFGPAPRGLAQLPLRMDVDELLVADGGFSAPVGPDRWRLGQGGGGR